MKIDWKHLTKTYAGLWVALADDEKTVIASGSTVQEVQEAASKSGHEHPFLTFVPEETITFVGTH